MFCFAIWLQNWNLFTEPNFQMVLYKVKILVGICLSCQCSSVPVAALLCSPVLFFAPFLKLGTRHILEAMQAAGHEITTLFLCGGLSKNPLFVQMHADITGKGGGMQGKEGKYFYLRCLSTSSSEKNKDFLYIELYFASWPKQVCNEMFLLLASSYLT